MIWPGRGGGSGLAATVGTGRGDGGACAGSSGGGAGAGGGIGSAGPRRDASGGRSGWAAGRVLSLSSVVNPLGSGAVSAGSSSWAEGRSAGAAFVSTSASPGSGAGAASPSSAGAAASRFSTKTPKCRRISSATSSSIELECVFFSVTPNCGRIAIITLLGCSHSRASSFIRIFFIRSIRPSRIGTTQPWRHSLARFRHTLALRVLS